MFARPLRPVQSAYTKIVNPIVLARPHWSPILPKIRPPVAQPRMKTEVAQVPNLTWVSGSACGSKSRIVIERDMVKIC